MFRVVPQRPIEICGHIFRDLTHLSINGVLVPRELIEALAETQRSSSEATGQMKKEST